MKVVSWKTFIAAMLGVAFIVFKIMTFENVVFDIAWIVLMGYLTIKAFKVAFSEKAYNEDVKKAEEGKIMMQELFGKFAPYAYYVPHILIGSGVLVAFIMPERMWRERSIVILVFLTIATLYLIWYFGKVAEYKRNKKEENK